LLKDAAILPNCLVERKGVSKKIKKNFFAHFLLVDWAIPPASGRIARKEFRLQWTGRPQGMPPASGRAALKGMPPASGRAARKECRPPVDGPPARNFIGRRATKTSKTPRTPRMRRAREWVDASR